jgi:transposase
MQEVVPVKKISYRTVGVETVDVARLVSKVGSDRCIVAIDIAKEAMVAGFANTLGECQALVRFSHPKQTLVFIALLTAVREAGLVVEIAMEPTGVYGDALRYQLGLREFPVFRVDPNRAHALAEVLDGVPSRHDPKACTLIADLHARKLSTRWRDKNALERDARSLIDERDLFARPFERGVGQLEAVISRSFPELSGLIDHSCSWHLHLLAELPSPAHVAAAPERARELLRRVSRGRLSASTIDTILTAAQASLGVPMSPQDAVLVAALARHMLYLREQMKGVDHRVRELVSSHPKLQPMVTTLGATTTAAIIADAGDPAEYDSCPAFEKALGLNLKENTSGTTSEHPVHHITKRGPARARRYLFLAALRVIKDDPIVCAWYQERAAFKAGQKLKAVVAVMRKLARAIVHLARGIPFDARKLFDARRLELAEPVHEPTSLAAG